MAIPRNLANIAPHVNASSTELVVNDGGANLDFRVEGDTNANLLVADAGAEKVGFGTNTFNTNGGVIQVSNGISFPATQSACADVNTLDDYEEGTWTPNLGGTATYTFRAGKYTKIGNVVYVDFYIEVLLLGTGSNSTFSGLPFALVGNVGNGSSGYQALLAISPVSLTPQIVSSTSVRFDGRTAADATASNTLAIYGNGSTVLGSIVYTTSS